MNPMEYIWEKVAGATGDGEKAIVYRDVHDLKYLYASGFADTSKFTLDEWLRAFADSKREDGSYRLTHPQWMAKKKYRFDPLSTKEESHSIQNNSEASFKQLKDLIATAKTVPSSEIPSETGIPVAQTPGFKRQPRTMRI